MSQILPIHWNLLRELNMVPTKNNKAPVFLIICEGASDRKVFEAFQRYVKWKYPEIPKCKRPIIEIMDTHGDTLETYKKDAENKICGKYMHSECTDLIAERIKGRLSDLINGKKISLAAIRGIFIVTDTDGVFINDSDVFSDSPYSANTYYTEDGIYTHSFGRRKSIIERNKMKRENIEWVRNGNPVHLLQGKESRDLPLWLHYMSCNLDHVTVNDSNNYEKYGTAENWLNMISEGMSSQRIYDYFDTMLPEDSSYKSSWTYISEIGAKHSLERGTNCKFILDALDAYIQRQLAVEVK